MGNNISYQPVTFDDVISASNDPELWTIITTLPESSKCLITGTCPIDEEEKKINDIIDKRKRTNIIIYGSSSNDLNVIKKYNQLRNAGLRNVYIYTGGLFEWLLLQDIYTADVFGTTTTELDILKYSGKPLITKSMLQIHA
uniref:Rhodanese domain-containing protein n=1 Tax=viral metagenome TaxID=1070528 RepID=A0A6C0BR35_9ZZZZ